METVVQILIVIVIGGVQLQNTGTDWQALRHIGGEHFARELRTKFVDADNVH